MNIEPHEIITKRVVNQVMISVAYLNLNKSVNYVIFKKSECYST